MLALALLLATTQAKPVIAPDALLTTGVAGLQNTRAEATVLDVSGMPFKQARRFVIREKSQETNATQLTIPNAYAVRQGDTMLASFWLRSPSKAQVEFLFEKATNPWTKSVTRGFGASNSWRQVFVAFRSSESYQPNQAMVSLRVAFGPQTVEIGGLKIDNYENSKSLDQLVEYATSQTPLGKVRVAFDFKNPKQTMMGLGGNFCQPRYGHTEPMDVVGEYALKNLHVAHARIGLPLNNWNPSPGEYKDDAQARASLLALAEMTRRKIPTVVSIWEGPGWMLGGRPEQSGRTLPADKYKDCIEAIARYLVVARDKYKAPVAYFSFNEPDYGVNFKFTSAQMIEFIRQAGPRFEALKLRTKFLIGDTANGSNFVPYAKPILGDASIARYLGPIAFHCWDSLSASDGAYEGIAELGRKYKKTVWCLEAGHDAQLWQAENPWGSWENGLRTAMAYERTIRLTGATLMDYWTYQDNYPLVDKNGPRPYAVFQVMKQMEDVFAPGSKVVLPKVPLAEFHAIATSGPGRRFGILIANPLGAGSVLLGGLPAKAKVRIVVSDATGQNRSRSAETDRQGNLTVAIPLRSVVTVLGS